MYQIVFTHFDVNDALSEYNTIVLETKKKKFKTHEDALRYITVEEKRNITKKYRRLYPAGEGDPIYLNYEVRLEGKNRVTLDVLSFFSDKILERYEYLIVEA